MYWLAKFVLYCDIYDDEIMDEYILQLSDRRMVVGCPNESQCLKLGDDKTHRLIWVDDNTYYLKWVDKYKYIRIFITKKNKQLFIMDVTYESYGLDNLVYQRGFENFITAGGTTIYFHPLDIQPITSIDEIRWADQVKITGRTPHGPVE